MEVRGLTRSDLCAIKDIDSTKGNTFELAPMIENDCYCLEEEDESEYAFGAFIDNKLIGYCTIGGADVIDDEPAITKDPKYNPYHDLLLSDVYILPEYRNNGYGSCMVEEAIKIKQGLEPDANNIYLTVMDENLGCFYQKIGFSWVDETDPYYMAKELDEKEIDL